MNEINNFIEPAKAFYEIILDGVVITNLSGKISYTNTSACKLLKYDKKQDFKNKSIDECLNGSNSFNDILRDLANQKILLTTKTFNRKDGAHVDIALCVSLLTDSENKPIGLQIILKNPHLPEHEQSYIENRSSLLHSLNNQSREIILVSDLKQKRNVFCSQSIEKMLGWTQNDFINGGWAFAMSLTHPDDAERIAVQFKKEIEKRTRVKFTHDHEPFKYEYRKRHKNGSWLNIISETQILERDENQQIQYLISFLKDVTTSKSETKIETDLVDYLVNNEIINLLVPGKVKTTKNSVSLSKREIEILQLVRKGLSTKEISDILNLKITSINSYRKNLMLKMNVKNTAELVQKSNQFFKS
ncbi:MAG: PAS domain-containing protein [Bacteroidia bacterium]|nr:PAS domain-containing protein [Bacteroidia bacterium]